MTREEAIKVLSSYDVNGVWADVDGKPYNAEEQAEAFDMAIKALQAEPVLRCKDCKHYIPSEEIPHRGWCDDALQNLFKEDFYCGFGKRREP